MRSILPSDIVETLGEPDPLIKNEIVQTRASLEEWKQALSLSENVGTERFGDFTRYDGVSDRVRRLIDLLSVADRHGDRQGRTASIEPETGSRFRD
jgi:hypothetical protein